MATGRIELPFVFYTNNPLALYNSTTINIGPDQTEVTVPVVTEDVVYIGRVQMNLNDGKKRKFLYFQSDFILKP